MNYYTVTTLRFANKCYSRQKSFLIQNILRRYLCVGSDNVVGYKGDNIIINHTESIEFKNVHLAKFVLDSISKYGNSVALINGETNKQITFNEFEYKVFKTANLLLKLGLKKDDKVTLFSPNNLDYPVVVVGVALVGAACSTVNNSYTADELLKLVKVSGSSVIFTTHSLAGIVHQILPLCPSIKHTLLIGDESDNFLNLDSYIGFTDFKDVGIDTDDVVALPFSSGTTGVPKGVQLTHRNLVSNLQQALHPERLDYTPNDRILSILPYFHAFGYMANMLAGLVSGSTQVVLSKFDPHVFLKCLNNYQCTYLTAVPPMLLFMCRHPLATNITFPHLRRIITGAAPTSVSLMEEMRCKLNQEAIVKQAYGLTETSPAVSMGLNSLQKDGSVGPVMPNTELKIIDENGKRLAKKELGELCVRGPQVMKGYYKNMLANEQTFLKDGWLRTGDIGSVDDDNHIYIFDRSKELIKVKGFQVAPAELESILLSHPTVADTAVIGMPDEQLGEKPRAFVVLRNGESIREEDLMKFVAEKVAPFKRLNGGVQFISEIPKSPTGKILRRVLKERFVS